MDRVSFENETLEVRLARQQAKKKCAAPVALFKAGYHAIASTPSTSPPPPCERNEEIC
jgi:hypothetical protein